MPGTYERAVRFIDESILTASALPPMIFGPACCTCLVLIAPEGEAAYPKHHGRYCPVAGARPGDPIIVFFDRSATVVPRDAADLWSDPS